MASASIARTRCRRTRPQIGCFQTIKWSLLLSNCRNVFSGGHRAVMFLDINVNQQLQPHVLCKIPTTTLARSSHVLSGPGRRHPWQPVHAAPLKRQLDQSGNGRPHPVTRPSQSIVKIEHHASRSEKCVILLRVSDFDLSNPWEGLRVASKIYHFTMRSVAFNRPTRPTHCKNRSATLPRVQSLDHANPL